MRAHLRHVLTVVTAQGLYAWIAAHVEPETFRRFAVFWGFSWFAVVKGWHAAEYAILFLFLKAALDRIATTDPRRNIILPLGFCLLFALSDEYHQTFVPGRNGTWTDVGIDALGAVLAALISNLRRGRRKRVVTVTSEPDDTWTQDALNRNDLDAIKRRVLEDPDYLTDRDFEYQTPLLRAVEFTNIELVEFLLQHGADPDPVVDDGYTSLLTAIEMDHPDSLKIVSLLIAAGADIHQTGTNGWTPLHMAAARGHLEKARLLIEAGAEVDLRKNIDGEETPLMEAGWLGRAELVRLLLEHGADPTLPNSFGKTPLRSLENP